MVAHTFNPMLGRLGQRDCYGFEHSIGHVVSNRLLELCGETLLREGDGKKRGDSHGMFLCVEQQNLLL